LVGPPRPPNDPYLAGASPGVEHGTVATRNAFKAGGELIIHYSEEGGRKVAHLIHHG